jgi:hypothetical protein
LGHLAPFRHTGNKSLQVISGYALVLLAFYNRLHPKATGLEKMAFMWNAYGRYRQRPRFFSEGEITKAEQRLGLSRKRSSTTANQAFTPINVIRRWVFWNLPYPHGIADISRDDMIDIDEAKIILEMANRKYGKAVLQKRCRETGLYGHGGGRLLLLGVSGGPDGGRWLFCDDRPGTDVQHYGAFIDHILNDIGPGTPLRRRCFVMDNLIVHWNPVIIARILLAGHRIAFRSPYCPFDGAIEFVFNTIENTLRSRMEMIHNVDDLDRHIRAIIRLIPQFSPYFDHIGFRP